MSAHRRRLRALVGMLITLVSLATVTGNAAARPLFGGNSLYVTSYWATPDKQGNVVGQSWFGCDRPAGSWGQSTAYSSFSSTPC